MAFEVQRDQRDSPATPRVTVVIPTWNGADLLDRYSLPSLSLQTFRDFRVVVVDNGSSDGTADYIAAQWPDATVIALDHNCGFARAVNVGIHAAQSEFVALLNNDVELDSRWLEELVAALDADASAGCATGKMLRYDDRQMIVSAGDVITWDGMVNGRGKGETDTGQLDTAEHVFSATGGASIYRRSAFELVGLFDEDFFAYVEDVDWGFRAQLAGLTCWYTPRARSYHVGGATSKKVSGLFSYMMVRNSSWMIIKNFPTSMMIRNAPRIAIALLLRSLRSIRSGARWPVVRAWIAAVAGLPRMLRKRRLIQAGRKVDVAYLDRLFAPQSLGSPRLTRIGDRLALGRRSRRSG